MNQAEQINKNEDDLPPREGATVATTYAIPDIEPLQGMLVPDDLPPVSVEELNTVAGGAVQHIQSMFAPTNDLPPITEEELNTVDYPIKEEADEVVIPRLKPQPIEVNLVREVARTMGIDDSELLSLATLQKKNQMSPEDLTMYTTLKDINKPEGNKYKVKSGDNLWNIAKNNDVTVQQLIDWNNIENADNIAEGATLIIGGSYTPNEIAPKTTKTKWIKPAALKTGITTDYLTNNYNASPADKETGIFTERNQYTKRMNSFEKKYQEDKLSDLRMANIQTVDNMVLNNATNVFSIEMRSTGIDVDELRDAVRRVYGAETNYGTTESKVSPTGAQGELQVIASTMFDLYRLGVLGKGFRKAVGLTEAQLKAIVVSPEKDKNGNDKVNQEATRKFLHDNKKGNVLVGMAKILNMVKATQNRNKKAGVPNEV
jgi:murein DD-endopeptidase MepM/ murein hydrolase activator NlpD